MTLAEFDELAEELGPDAYELIDIQIEQVNTFPDPWAGWSDAEIQAELDRLADIEEKKVEDRAYWGATYDGRL